jgi:hypothetical protein
MKLHGRFARSLFWLSLAAAWPLTQVQAEPFTFQGHLAQSGTPLDGTTDLVFKLYNAQSGGTLLGAPISATGWPVVDGVFALDLDFTGIAFDGSARWLEVEVDGTTLAGRIEILPAPVSASSNALRGRNVAATAPTAGQVLAWNGSSWAPAADASGSSYSAGNGLTLSGTTFSVNFAGTGAANTASRSDHAHYGATWSGNASNTGLQVFNSAPSATSAIQGFYTGADSDVAGVYGESAMGQGVRGFGKTGVRGTSNATDGTGVHGIAFATSGATSGVIASANSPDGYGLRARNLATSGSAFGIFSESAGVDGTAIHGSATSSAAGATIGVRGSSAASNGTGVHGEASDASGSTKGVLGRVVSPSGFGVFGENNANSGLAYGVVGNTDSPSGVAVFGDATGGAVGVRGVGSTGVDAQGTQIGLAAVTSGGADAIAVVANALHPSATVHGVKATVASPLGVGVYAENQASSGDAYGVVAATASTGGTAIYGLAPGGVSGSPIGVRGETGAGGGYGLYGVNTASTAPAIALGAVSAADGGLAAEIRAVGGGNAKGLDAVSSGTGGTAHAVRARLTDAGSTGDAIYAYANSTSAKAARFANVSGTAIALAGGGTVLEATGNASIVGDVAVFGTLSKGGGSFKIDHPLDPANKYLLHSFVESPDMMNIYNGNVITDARGHASIELPDWFETLNRDFRYQLTVIGSFARAMVAEEVHGNRFAIRTESPNTKVSWQVTGIRKDGWAEKHRIPVELEKTPAERGKYLHPEVFGAPAAKRLGVDVAKAAVATDATQPARNRP